MFANSTLPHVTSPVRFWEHITLITAKSTLVFLPVHFAITILSFSLRRFLVMFSPPPRVYVQFRHRFTVITSPRNVQQVR